MSDFLYATAGIAGGFGLIAAIIVGVVNYTGQGPTFRDRILSSPTLSPLLIIHYFLPYALIVLTIFMDIMSQLPQGLFGLLIGFIAMVLNRLIGGSPDFINDLCEIPGLKVLASRWMPQSLLFVTTIVTYLASFVTVSSYKNVNYTNQFGQGQTIFTPTPSTRIGATWGLAISVILIQLFGILSTPGCLTEPLVLSIPGTSISSPPLPPATRAILAIIIGGALGGGLAVPIANSPITQPQVNTDVTASYGSTVSGVQQAKGPTFVREQFQLGAGLGEGPMIPITQQEGQIPVDIAKSSGAVTPGESSDQFVCEAYKNGQLVTSTLVG